MWKVGVTDNVLKFLSPFECTDTCQCDKNRTICSIDLCTKKCFVSDKVIRLDF